MQSPLYNHCWTTSHVMKTFIILILSCASVLGAETGIRVVTTVTTNADTGSVYRRDVFTRNGKTNLVSNTVNKGGVFKGRIQRLYHDGLLVGDYEAFGDTSGFSTEAGSPFAVTFEFSPSKDIRSAVIGTKDGLVLDAFTCTNGIFSPVESSVIQKANAVFADMKRLFDPDHVRKTSPQDFVREAEDLIEKHKDR